MIASTLATLLALGLDPAPAGGHDGSHVAAAEPGREKGLGWAPPAPNPTDSDWIQLDTGEWLKGRIELIQDDSVSFDSDKLDDLEFDWSDVALLVTAKEHTFRFTGNRIVRGTAEMRGEVVRIRVGDRVEEFHRSEMVSMIPGAGRERDYWSGALGLSFGGHAGNTSQLSFSTSLAVARETTSRKASLLYTGNVAAQQGDISANNHRATAGLDLYLTRKFFINIARFEFFQDEFQNIAWRVTPSTGVGYDVIWQKKLKWQVGTALGYQAVEFDSVDTGSDRSDDFPLLFFTRLDVDLPKRFAWTNRYQLQVITTDVGNSNQHLDSTLSFDFIGPLDFDTTFQWDWIARPQADSSGVRPESSDFRISVGLSIDL